jgi:N-acetylneuraminate synthase
LPAGYVIQHATADDDFYMAIPLLKGQLSCRELMSGEVLRQPINKDEPVMIDAIDGPYSQNAALRNSIYDRGIDR